VSPLIKYYFIYSKQNSYSITIAVSMTDQGPPKKALVPFFLFRKDVFTKVQKENPDKKVS